MNINPSESNNIYNSPLTPALPKELFKELPGKKYNSIFDNTALKIIGLISVSGLAAIGLKSIFDGYNNLTPPSTPCFEMNENNIEVLLQAGAGNTTAYETLTQLSNCPIPLHIIKKYHLDAIKIKENSIDASDCDGRIIEERRYKIKMITTNAIAGAKWAMDDLESLHEEFPIDDMEQIRTSFNEAVAKNAERELEIKASRENMIREHTIKATTYGENEASLYMTLIKKLHDQSPIKNYEEILKSFIAHTQKNNHIQILTERAKVGNSNAMNDLEAHERVSKVEGIVQIRISFNEAVRKIDIEKYTADAKIGDRLAMIRLEQLNKESPVNDIQSIRVIYEEARALLDN